MSDFITHGDILTPGQFRDPKNLKFVSLQTVTHMQKNLFNQTAFFLPTLVSIKINNRSPSYLS